MKAQVCIDRIGFVLESIEEIDIGWMNMYKFITAVKGRQVGNRIFIASQIGDIPRVFERCRLLS